MIHYHGTPIGGDKFNATNFLFGRHALVPFTYPVQLGVVMECCQSFCLDNGAFTIWKKGEGSIDVDKYIDWVRSARHHPGFDFALIPDVIDGSEDDNDSLLNQWPRDVHGVPVYHMHESLERAARLSREWPMIAIGSSGAWPSPGNKSWSDRMAAIMDVVCDETGKPFCKIHGLRMMDPAIFTRYPFRSVDSTNCAQNGARNGHAIDKNLCSYQGAIVTAWRIEAHQSSQIWDRSSSYLVREKQSVLNFEKP